MIVNDDVFVRLVDMPPALYGFTRENSDLTHTVILNSRISAERRMRTYLHELDHIRNDDIRKECSADEIEREAHSGRG